jgi:hypothetical protein
MSKFNTRENLLAQAATWMASEHNLNHRLPGPSDDAEMEYRDELLLQAAREYVEAHKDVKTAQEIYVESHQ